MKKLNTVSPSLLAPLQGFWRWLMPTVIPIATAANEAHRDFASKAFDAKRQTPQRHCAARPVRAAIRPLRIVRVLDQDSSPANVGRMVISGRMADVCAELDRLVAFEQTLH